MRALQPIAPVDRLRSLTRAVVRVPEGEVRDRIRRAWEAERAGNLTDHEFRETMQCAEFEFALGRVGK